MRLSTIPGMGAALRWGIRAVVVGCVVLFTLTTGIPNAIANPGDGGLVADSPSLSLAAINGDTDIALYGLQSTQTVSIPVPPGLSPAALNAVAELPPGVTAGSISVTQGNRQVSRIELPPVQAPVSIPLTGAEVVGNALTVLLRGQLVPPGDYCLQDAAIPLRLADATVAFTGREIPPTTVADFLPPILQKLTIYLPDVPSRTESSAALRLTTAVVARYGKRLDVDVVPLPRDSAAPAPPPAPFERQIVVREGPGPGVSLDSAVDVPTLYVTGSGNELTNQIRMLTADLSRLAVASKAVAGPLRTSPQLPPDTTTIRDLGQNGVNATALKPQVSVALDQTRLGRPVHDVRVQLKGSYTPLPENVGGQIVASVGGHTVDHWPADSSGTIDRWVNVPDELLQRYTNLNVAVDITGDTGPCGRFQPVTLTIDGGTVVQSSAADPPSPAGFQSLPQALLPRTQVGIGADAFADTERAATILEGLQRLSALPIDTDVVSMQDALDSASPAVLIAADGWSDDRVSLPVALGASTLDVQRLATDGEKTTLELDPGQQIGSLQTVVDGERTMLIATSNGSAGQLDSLLNWLDQDQMRWSRLTGTAVLAAPDHEPVTVDSDAPRSVSAVAAGKEGPPWPWLAAGTAAVAVGLLVALYLIRRRRRPASR